MFARGRIELRLLAALAALTAAGAVILAQPWCTPLGARDAGYFWAYHYWACAFDALSAACGAGLTVGDVAEGYTRAGRWVLVALGAAGAFLYLAAVLGALRRIGASLAVWAAPRTRHMTAVFGCFLMLAVAIGLVTTRFADRPPPVEAVAAESVAAACSLGAFHRPASESFVSAAAVATIAWLAALGWPLWFFAAPPLLKRHIQARHALLIAAGYTAMLLIAAWMIVGFETPRGRRGPAHDSALLADQPPAMRFARGLAQVAAAAGAGVPTEDLAERSVSEGTKATLALIVLVGPATYAAAGGISWILLLWTFSSIVAGAPPASGPARHVTHWFRAGLTLTAMLLGATLLCALGLLMIETLTASRFTPPHTLADALLDAASAVGGANLTSGLAAAVTDRNLASGIRMRFDLYQIGMAWLMLFMIAGRIAPVLVLRRLADAVTPEPDLKPPTPILR